MKEFPVLFKTGTYTVEIDMDYNYEDYERILTKFLLDSWRDPDELEIGEDISDMQEVKIIFDGYGDLETDDEWIEGGNRNMESYAIFIHKDTLNEDNFVFPEHDTAWNMIIHRPKEEVCLYAWYDVENDCWDFNPLEDRLDSDNTMDEKDVMKILYALEKRYYPDE